MLDELNNISFGWEPSSESDNWWTNSLHQEDVILRNNSIEFSTTENIYSSYQRRLENMGYRLIDQSISGGLPSFNEEKVYESKKYRFTIQMYMGQYVFINSAVVSKR